MKPHYSQNLFSNDLAVLIRWDDENKSSKKMNMGLLGGFSQSEQTPILFSTQGHFLIIEQISCYSFPFPKFVQRCYYCTDLTRQHLMPLSMTIDFF
mmetsp:Transcript_16395/g.29828  ORF Transcript_16395/g.29828 Transcript_16395/m.29828 type:complete len:96 (-) Transcript_16395:716-1003(-)